ncbi:MAG: sialidase family protein [Bythopirellula sp.]
MTKEPNIARVASLVVCLLTGMVSSLSAKPLFQEKPLYVAGLDEVKIYRIPSLLVTQQGTILALCEAREGGDKSPTDLVLKRSDDLGRTWGPVEVVLKGKPGAIMNPTPVIDRRDGTIVLVCNYVYRGKGIDQIWMLRSTDNGKTWSEPSDITDTVGKVHPGPGVSIQLKSGRLLVPGRSTDNNGQSLIIFSDDRGKTWAAGQGAGPDTNESQAVQLADGSVMLNMRSTRGKGCRAVAVSQDGGQTWGALRDDTTLIEPICQGSIVRYTLADTNGRNRLLFANPAQADRGNRTNMSVKLSYDEGKTWPVSKTVHAGPSAYCCLTVLSDGTVGLLYEGGPRGRYESILFARFNLEWLTDGNDLTAH